MKNIGNEADKIIRERRLKKKDIAEKMGISDVYLSQLFKKDSIDAKLLEKLSHAIRVPITFWFEEKDIKNLSIAAGAGSAASIYGDAITGELASKDKEIEHLKMLLMDKDIIIEEKERTIQILLKNK